MAWARNGTSEYVKLEHRLVLLAWLNGLFGYENTRELLAGMKAAGEGFDASGRSYVYHLLEGSEIIQLFGRGVRLRGKGFTLKRSSALDGKHPDHVSLLETLNIFAVRANYMSQFRGYLEKVGVETEGAVELPLFIRPNTELLGRGLVVPRVLEDGIATTRYSRSSLPPLEQRFQN